MTNHIPCTLLAMLLSGTSMAQGHGEIRGKVLDPDGLGLPYAHVITDMAGNQLGATTDMDGRFVLKPLPPGTYTLRISFTGFKTAEIPGIGVVADRATYVKDHRMSFMSALDTIEVVYYRRKLIDVDDPSRMSLLAEEFQRDPNRNNPVAFIATNFPGVSTGPNGEGLYFRGSRSENMITFVDGVKLSGEVPRLPASSMSSVSVYTGGLPARYGDVTGGVVVIETKGYFDVFQAAMARERRLEKEERD